MVYTHIGKWKKICEVFFKKKLFFFNPNCIGAINFFTWNSLQNQHLVITILFNYCTRWILSKPRWL